MIGPELEARVKLFCDVAKVNGSLLSVSDLLKVLPGPESRDELERAIRTSPALSTTYELKSGFVVERSEVPAESSEAASRARARRNLLHALRVAPLLLCPEARLVGISGSTSYKSASRSRDIDFFCVTEAGSMWIFLTRALILSRVFRLLRAGAPEICLSCTLDSGYAEKIFAEPNGSLFARDALSVVVTAGGDLYRRLLRRGSWMRSFYPRLYSERVGGAGPGVGSPPRASSLRRAINRFLYVTVGNYIRIKARLHNRRLAAWGLGDAIFVLLIGEDRCVYESARYRKMRAMYDSLETEE